MKKKVVWRLRSVWTVLCVAGCAGQPLHPAAPAPTPIRTEVRPAASGPEEPSSGTAGASTVRILDAGAAPRRKLRYDLRPGTSDHIQIDLKMKMSMAMAGSQLGRMTRVIDMPTLRLGLRAAVAETLPGQATRLAFEVEEGRLLGDGPLDPHTRRAVEAEIAGMIGIQGSTRVSPRGEETETVFDRANASPTQQEKIDRMEESLRDSFTRFPEGEVGTGAAWEVTSRIRSGLFMMDRKVIFTLRGFSGSTARLDFEIEISAPEQSLQFRTGQSGTLHSFEGHGTGATTIALDRIAQPSTTKTSVAAGFSVGSGAESVDTNMVMDIALSTRPVTVATQ